MGFSIFDFPLIFIRKESFMIKFILFGSVRVSSEVNGVSIADLMPSKFDCVYEKSSGKCFYVRKDGTHPNEVQTDRIGPNLLKALKSAK